jgi:hypothetical protein
MTRQTAINAFCRQCIYDRYQPGTAKACPLYQYRPVSRTSQTVGTRSARGNGKGAGLGEVVQLAPECASLEAP